MRRQASVEQERRSQQPAALPDYGHGRGGALPQYGSGGAYGVDGSADAVMAADFACISVDISPAHAIPVKE